MEDDDQPMSRKDVFTTLALGLTPIVALVVVYFGWLARFW